MTEGARFWWDWWVQLFVAVGTCGAVIVAVLGDWIKARIAGLSISMENRFGVYTPTQIAINGQPVAGGRREGRYYQLRVRNRWPPFLAEDVHVFLLRVDELTEDGNIISTWQGEIPLNWQHKDFWPGGRTIGNPPNADLFATSSDGALTLQLAFVALNITPAWKKAVNLRLVLEARGRASASKPFAVGVNWDGRWDRDGAGVIVSGRELSKREFHNEQRRVCPPAGGRSLTRLYVHYLALAAEIIGTILVSLDMIRIGWLADEAGHADAGGKPAQYHGWIWHSGPSGSILLLVGIALAGFALVLEHRELIASGRRGG